MKEAPDKTPKSVLTARVHCLARYVRQLHQALIAEGVCEAAERLAGGWRSEDASQKQRQALVKMVRVSNRLGTTHRGALGKLAQCPILTRGLASDMFDLLKALQKLKSGERAWEPALVVSVPPDHAFDPVVVPVFIGAALVDGWAAVAIVKDGEVLYQGARGTRDGDTLDRLYARAEEMARDTYGAADVRRAIGAEQAADRAIAAKVGAPLFRGDWAGVGG